jgi:Ca2+-binding EF-hand superfamily protein
LKILEEGLENMEKSDLDGDGKFTFEEFLEAMKENQEANKLIKQIADA